MHTAEHLLNACMTRMIGTPRSFSAHLDGAKGKCDYRFSRDLSAEEAASVERAVRDAIGADYPVKEEFLSREEAGKRFDLSRLPEGAGDSLRIVVVEGFDAIPCAGPHASRTGEIGGFELTGRSFADGVLRLRFKIGPA